MSERDVRKLLTSVPVDEDAEGRAWELVRLAFAEHEPVVRRRRVGLAVAFAVIGVATVAAALSPPGRAVVNAVRRSIGIERATPALFRLPSAGRLLVSGPGGAWVVTVDGSKRLLGEYPQASWSPHGLYVVGASTNELTTMEPTGQVHWKLARPQIHFPRWSGTNGDTRIAYLTTSRLHVVGGDGRGDVDAEGLPAAAQIAPAWRPTGNLHVLAYVTTHGRVTVLNPDRGKVWWVSLGYASPRALAWSPDGKELVLAAQSKVVIFSARTGRARVVHVEGVRAIAFAPDGRLALLRGRAVLLLEGSRVRTLFTAPGRLAGVAWSPNGRWLLTGLPSADQWVFLQTVGGQRVLAVSHIRAQFDGEATLDGWIG